MRIKRKFFEWSITEEESMDKTIYDNVDWMRQFDEELRAFEGRLFEADLRFAPR